MKNSITIDDKVYYEGDYRVRPHGLLYIVEQLYYEFDPIWIEDSRWKSLSSATRHCELLNEKH